MSLPEIVIYAYAAIVIIFVIVWEVILKKSVVYTFIALFSAFIVSFLIKYFWINQSLKTAFWYTFGPLIPTIIVFVIIYLADKVYKNED
ncbi:amino acid transporter [Staphylococcus auricularis]|uniref:Uncharacterized protein n=1 Tax=Staphylococcus auricularis TaxID=29379 RepID=A0AAP8PPJ1_9STAP|nr:hypothetical protein [Staphylococcus auricularis]PNZ67592.1 hypothetical protein CD158_05665 [Staphylococcus auricularis]BCU53367.1 hypothetical protein JCM2421_21390 [Staphylococcus auricularis]SQJ17292.1 Uncharacterised protein [Staphylococcus auricularis]